MPTCTASPQPRLPRRTVRSFVAGVCVGTLAIASACAPHVYVRTQIAPQADFGAYHTFVLLIPRMQGGGNPAAQTDPMLDNSITNEAMHRELRQQLEALGYRPGGANADIGVAFYAASRQALDVTMVNYGYPYRPWWWGQEQVVTPVTQGTVVIDVIDRHANRLVWRGIGRSEVSDDPGEYAKALRRTVAHVLKRLPRMGS